MVLSSNLTNSFKPTIIVNSVSFSMDLEENYPAEDRMNGFMVMSYSETVYWNVEKQDFQKEPI